MTQTKLNEQLFQAVTSPKIDLARIEELLKLGANPLGSYMDFDPDYDVLGEIFCYLSDDEYLDRHIDDVIRLFLQYGMDISARKIQCDNIDPLWELAFVASEGGLKVLKRLLDHGLDVDSVESMAEHILVDMCISPESVSEMEQWFYERDVFSIRMILLAASYPEILQNSTYLQKELGCEKNGFDTEKFRNWNAFDYTIDFSHCDGKNGFDGSVVTVTEKATGETAWVLEL